MEKEKLIERVNSMFKEEMWGRLDPKDVGISRFRILDDLFNSIVAAGIVKEVRDICKEHIQSHPDSIVASYLIGLTGYHLDIIDDKMEMRRLIDMYQKYHKWVIVELLSEKVLEYGESSFALKSLATSLERLGRSKEAIPVWENLLKIDRFDAEVAKKLAVALIDEDKPKSIQYMKLSIEGHIKNGLYDEIADLWNKLVQVSWEDIQFFERIERMLIEARQYELTASLLKVLLHKYKDEEHPDQSIQILKKILEYTPNDTAARRELVKLYEKKYGSHSQFQLFLKLSKLNNFKYPVKHAIQDFENSIIFDKGHYVRHRSWGVGRIVDITPNNIIIDFKEKPGHQMSVQMALQALTPLKSDHIQVLKYEDYEGLKKIFEEDFLQFFEILIRSYNGSIALADVKKELIPDFVSEKAWAKWWSNKRTEIKKSPLFGISPEKKDVIIMRDKPLTFADELLDNFLKTDSFTEKLDVVIEFVNNIDAGEGVAVAQFFVDYFSGELKGDSVTRKILSYFILNGLSKFIDAKKLKLDQAYKGIVAIVKESQDLPSISRKIGSYDYKKDLINLIKEAREDWADIYSQILFETPVRIHKYIVNILIRSHEYGIINRFVEKTLIGAKEFPEIFLWVARNLLTKSWDYEWLDYSREQLVLTLFRLMNELKKIEQKGSKLKNIALDIIFDNDAAVLKDIVNTFDIQFLGKVYDIVGSIPYIEDSMRDKFFEIIKSRYPDFKPLMKTAEEEWKVDAEVLITTQEGYVRKQEELNRLVNVELAAISKELAKVSDATGDVRENVEYNALLEKQSILKRDINKLESEIKKAQILDLNTVSTDKVNIGTVVTISGDGEKETFAILGPWDADFEKRILSYRSPIAQALLGKKQGDVVEIRKNEQIKQYTIESIEKYKP
ncbi:MAG TPA: transcription elongation factor GreA [Spirochaetota bacterium]|nr:transcription elongation factor GreA [Spirochaetota bacterium]